jgi:hypothetical protein
MGICAFIGNYVKKVSFFINDFISPDDKKKMYIPLYMYLNELSNTYNVNINFVEYYGIRSAI